MPTIIRDNTFVFCSSIIDNIENFGTVAFCIFNYNLTWNGSSESVFIVLSLIMQQVFHEIVLNTKGRNFYDFTEKTLDWINKQKIKNGILNINILHTSASLVIQENADPDVLYDLNNFFTKLVPMNNKLYKHTTEVKMTCLLISNLH